MQVLFDPCAVDVSCLPALRVGRLCPVASSLDIQECGHDLSPVETPHQLLSTCVPARLTHNRTRPCVIFSQQAHAKRWSMRTHIFLILLVPTWQMWAAVVMAEMQGVHMMRKEARGSMARITVAFKFRTLGGNFTIAQQIVDSHDD